MADKKEKKPRRKAIEPEHPTRKLPARERAEPERFSVPTKPALGEKRKRSSSSEPKKTKTKTKSSRRSTKGKSGGRRKKDPNAPKKALSAYMFFARDSREKVVKDNSDASFGEIGKILGEKWAKLKDRKKYEDLAAKDKKRYEKEMKSYKPEAESESESESGSGSEN